MLKKMYDGDETTYASWSVNQEQGDYYGLDLGKVTTVTDVSILQGKEDGHWDKFTTLCCNIRKMEKNGKKSNRP